MIFLKLWNFIDCSEEPRRKREVGIEIEGFVQSAHFPKGQFPSFLFSFLYGKHKDRSLSPADLKTSTSESQISSAKSKRQNYALDFRSLYGPSCFNFIRRFKITQPTETGLNFLLQTNIVPLEISRAIHFPRKVYIYFMRF